jgi:hypothetical protein
LAIYDKKDEAITPIIATPIQLLTHLWIEGGLTVCGLPIDSVMGFQTNKCDEVPECPTCAAQYRKEGENGAVECVGASAGCDRWEGEVRDGEA